MANLEHYVDAHLAEPDTRELEVLAVFTPTELALPRPLFKPIKLAKLHRLSPTAAAHLTAVRRKHAARKHSARRVLERNATITTQAACIARLLKENRRLLEDNRRLLEENRRVISTTPPNIEATEEPRGTRSNYGGQSPPHPLRPVPEPS